MPLAISTGATMMCSFGVAPASLVVLPTTTIVSGTPTANNTAFAPVANVPPFGACSSLANPTVAAATAAALGVLTPMPCVPCTVAPWLPGPWKTINGGMPAVDQTCTLMCAWGGMIKVLSPGQFKVVVS
jgi:Domain of unknown function (DUF4280)